MTFLQIEQSDKGGQSSKGAVVYVKLRKNEHEKANYKIKNIIKNICFEFHVSDTL